MSLPPAKEAPSLADSPKPQADPLTPTIFHEPWWLDIATGGDYGMAEVSENGAVVGRLPYFLKKRLGITYSIMPPMTHFLGPAVLEGEGNPPTRFLRRAEITHELLRQLPPASFYRYKCHRDITDAIAFQQEGFATSVQFTHEVLPDSEDSLWKALRTKKRKKIRRARDFVTVGSMNDPREFWRHYDRNLKRRGIANRCDEAMCVALFQGCLERGRGKIYTALDERGECVAAVLCIWDATTCFYYMSTRTQDAHQGAISLLAWEAMKEAAAKGLIFDFDGLNNSDAVLFFTEFGGLIRPRYIVTRATTIGHIAWTIKERHNSSRFFY